MSGLAQRIIHTVIALLFMVLFDYFYGFEYAVFMGIASVIGEVAALRTNTTRN
jgi:hypothetical protein